MTDIVIDHATVVSIDNPVADVEVITVGIPGIVGPQGIQGLSGPANVLSIGTVTTSSPGSAASATITGASPAQVLNLVLPQGTQGPQGDIGPAPTLSIGTVTTGAAGSSASATITGTTPNYTLNLTIPQGANGGGVVVGGAVGDVLMKNSTTDFDTKWSTPTNLPTASTLAMRDGSGQTQFTKVFGTTSLLSSDSASMLARKDYVDAIPVTTQTGTSYTLVLFDQRTCVRMNNAASTVVTVPPNSSVAFQVGTWIELERQGAGTLTAAAGSGVTFISPDSNLTARVVGSRIRLHKVATDTWVISGDLTSSTDSAVSAATSANTASTIVKRDVNGYSNFAGVTSVNAPANPNELTRKDYVDGKTWTSSQISDATSAATASKVIIRDANGRAQVADPSATADIATKNYVDTADNLRVQIGGDLGGTATAPTVTGGTHHTHTSAQISDAASASTANVVMKRDASGRASVADPSASTDISTKNYTDTQDNAMRRPAVNTQTVNYTLVLTDERKIVQMNSASAITLTIPLNSSVAFPVGTVIDVQQLGAGVVTLSPTGGVTMNLPDGLSTLNRQYSVVRLQKVGTDTWNVSHIGAANATSVSTANTFMKRDASGRASVADPSASTDIATKNYIDTKLAGKVSVGTVAPSTPSTNDIWIDTN